MGSVAVKFWVGVVPAACIMMGIFTCLSIRRSVGAEETRMDRQSLLLARALHGRMAGCTDYVESTCLLCLFDV